MKGHLTRVVCMAAIVMSVVMVTGCKTAPETAAGRAYLRAEVETALAMAQRSDPSLTKFLVESAGYAVFPSVGKGAAGVGGAYGKGVLYEMGKVVGYCDLSQASIGFQLGGQAYTELIAFETKEAVDKFKTGNYSLEAQATAVALKSGASGNAKYAEGVAIFTMSEEGLMYEASIGGQKFSYLPKIME